MTQEQKETLRQRFAARDCENQHEFDVWMQEANAVQHTFVDPYDKRLGEFTQRRASLMAQKSAINIQLDMLKQERVDVESDRRDVCADGTQETERFADIVEQARLYIMTDCGGSFERFAEWGLVRPGAQV